MKFEFDTELIDRGMMLSPPSPSQWITAGPRDIRFGWDPVYVERHGQSFSPWYFAKNCAALLGYVRVNGCNVLMGEMAEYLHQVTEPHIELIGGHSYIRNDFPFAFLWRDMQPPFYGAFMNNVTAFGYLQLYEATTIERFLSLAERLLATSVDRSATVPLVSGVASDFWLHEYVFHLDPKDYTAAQSMGLGKLDDWFVLRVFNGHIHALFALMRLRAMTGDSRYDNAIEQATNTMAMHLPQQLYMKKYFSYVMEPPIWPDYGQLRACHLAEHLGKITEHQSIQDTSASMRAFFTSEIEHRHKELVAEGLKDCLATFGKSELRRPQPTILKNEARG